MNESQPTRLAMADVHSGQHLEPDALKLGVGAVLVLCAAFAWQSIVAWADDQERRFHRRQLRDAYRRRHDWKKADLPHLRALGVNSAAEKRMQRLSGRGRPVVKQPRALHEEILGKLGTISPLVSGDASPGERLKAVKQWPWWPHHVEALYRGEYARAKAQGLRGPSTEAEVYVAEALGISAAQVHAICGEIRRMRREDPESANFPPMRMAEYQSWMHSPGGFIASALNSDAAEAGLPSPGP
ncbi:hypothetical protein DW352_02835 [Pseudolabrys taiwanensis]|uniref:Uncharacterized protein n=1 Tax=Pseudolabrys taiwanensis TaxID=331696 RepID=A0A345ZRJ9_9HYPH|nr:hypothetical protein [Pseudolabrys taiwanensis]AXK79546.1 hypothetical protein DW352_02835 [Pseudolabrys taiwanensis]